MRYREGLGSLRNVAECEEGVGHFAAARRAWLDLQRELRSNHNPKYADWTPDAESGAERLAPKVATLIVDVEAVTESGAIAPASGAEVTINGDRLSKDQFGAVLDEDPGHYVLRASSVGRDEVERAVDLAAGDSKRIEMRVLVGTSRELASRSGGVGTTAQRTESGSAWIATGVGAASLVGAGVAWIVRQNAADDLSSECPATRCADAPHYTAAQAIRDRGVSASTAAGILGLVGVAGVATGAVLFATRHSPSGGATLVVSPTSLSAVERF